MKNLLFLSVLILFITAAFTQEYIELDTVSDEIKPPSELIKLDNTNFPYFVKGGHENGAWFLMFFTPTCKKCRHMSKILKEVRPEVSRITSIGIINCEENREIQHAFKINEFPATVFVKNGKVYRFPLGYSPPTNEEVIQFIKKDYQNTTSTNIPNLPVDKLKHLKEGLNEVSNGLDEMFREDYWIIVKLVIGLLLVIGISIYLTEYVTKNYYGAKGAKINEAASPTMSPVSTKKAKHLKTE